MTLNPHNLPHPIYVGADLSAIGTLLMLGAGMLPSAAALFATIWYCILIWESKTVKAARAWVVAAWRSLKMGAAG